jgi:hypothetical protein
MKGGGMNSITRLSRNGFLPATAARGLAPVVELHRFRRRQTANKLLIALMIVCLCVFLGTFVTYVVNPAITASAQSTLDAWSQTGH